MGNTILHETHIQAFKELDLIERNLPIDLWDTKQYEKQIWIHRIPRHKLRQMAVEVMNDVVVYDIWNRYQENALNAVDPVTPISKLAPLPGNHSNDSRNMSRCSSELLRHRTHEAQRILGADGDKFNLSAIYCAMIPVIDHVLRANGYLGFAYWAKLYTHVPVMAYASYIDGNLKPFTQWFNFPSTVSDEIAFKEIGSRTPNVTAGAFQLAMNVLADAPALENLADRMLWYPCNSQFGNENSSVNYTNHGSFMDMQVLRFYAVARLFQQEYSPEQVDADRNLVQKVFTSFDLPFATVNTQSFIKEENLPRRAEIELVQNIRSLVAPIKDTHLKRLKTDPDPQLWQQFINADLPISNQGIAIVIWMILLHSVYEMHLFPIEKDSVRLFASAFADDKVQLKRTKFVDIFPSILGGIVTHDVPVKVIGCSEAPLVLRDNVLVPAGQVPMMLSADYISSILQSSDHERLSNLIYALSVRIFDNPMYEEVLRNSNPYPATKSVTAEMSSLIGKNVTVPLFMSALYLEDSKIVRSLCGYLRELYTYKVMTFADISRILYGEDQDDYTSMYLAGAARYYGSKREWQEAFAAILTTLDFNIDTLSGFQSPSRYTVNFLRLLGVLLLFDSTIPGSYGAAGSFGQIITDSYQNSNFAYIGENPPSALELTKLFWMLAMTRGVFQMHTMMPEARQNFVYEVTSSSFRLPLTINPVEPNSSTSP